MLLSRSVGSWRLGDGRGRVRRLLWLVLLVVSPVAASDAEADLESLAAAPETADWGAEIDLKLALTRGNTDITSGDFEIVAGREWQRWTATFYLEAAGAVLDSDVIAESVLLDLMAVRDLKPRLGLVGEFDFYKNRFAGLDLRSTAATGLAWSAVNSNRFTLDTMAGLGWQDERPVEPIAGDRSYPIGVLQARGVWNISDNTACRQTVYLAQDLQDSANSLIFARLTWRTRTNKWLSVEIDYVLRHDSDPILSADETDQSLKAGFVFSFGRATAEVADELLLPPR